MQIDGTDGIGDQLDEYMKFENRLIITPVDDVMQKLEEFSFGNHWALLVLVYHTGDTKDLTFLCFVLKTSKKVGKKAGLSKFRNDFLP